MKTENRTPFPVFVQRDYVEDTLGIVDATTKVTIDIGENGALAIARDQVPVHVEAHAEAPMGEVRYRRSDKIVELSVTGTVRGEAEKPFTRTKLLLSVGAHERRLSVYGPRWWLREGGELRASEPSPVTGVEMSWSLAYGGTKHIPAGFLQGTSLPAPSTDLFWAPNPSGIGFYRDFEDAAGKPLPQFEDPEHELRAWDDRCQPACWAPMPTSCGLRMDHFGVENGHLGNKDHAETPLLERMALNAPPTLQFLDIGIGTEISVTGFQGGHVFRVKVPTPPFQWIVRTGSREPSVFEPVLAAMSLRPNERKVCLLYRTRVSVPLIRGEEREAAQELVLVNAG